MRRGQSIPIFLGAVLVAAASAGCASSSATTAPPTNPPTNPPAPTASRARPIPGAAWEKVAPASVGLDATELAHLAQTAETGNSNCLVVERDGKIAGEWNYRGKSAESTQDVFSATKSVASTLVGIAQDEGDLHVSDRASKWIPEWRATASAKVTIRDILSGDSGREWSPQIDYSQLLRAPDKDKFAVGLSQAVPPGKVWRYNNSADQTLDVILRNATHERVTDFARDKLFGPLGMTHTQLATDAAGNTELFEGMRSNCEDMARFGLLFLNGGRWGNRQIVSRGWVEQATGHSSTKLNAAYGYLWWLNRKGVLSGPLSATNLAAAANPTTAHGRLVPGAPADMFWALGLGNQVVQVDPGSRTVVARLGTAAARPQPPTFGPAEASKVVHAVRR